MQKDYNDKSGLAYYWLEANMGLALTVLVFACVGLWGLLLEDTAELGIGRRLVRGMGPELAGIVIAAVTVNALAERRQEEERKKILISQLGSQYRDVTELAVIELKNREWLYDGSLSGARLWRANLSGARLWRANLSEADLRGANLSGAVLRWVTHWNVAQLEQAQTLEGALMPDKIRLGREGTSQAEPIEGPTFEQWKEQYLLKHGGSTTDLGDTNKAGQTEAGQTEP